MHALAAWNYGTMRAFPSRVRNTKESRVGLTSDSSVVIDLIWGNNGRFS
jgi:hypothetical protein